VCANEIVKESVISHPGLLNLGHAWVTMMHLQLKCRIQDI